MLKDAFLRNKYVIKSRVDWQLLLRLGIIFCILAFSVAFGLKGSEKIALFIGMACAGILAYLFFNRFPGSTILAVLLATFLITFPINTGRNVTLNSTILILAALFAIWFFQMFVVKKEIRLLDSQMNLPAVLFIITTTISWFIGMQPWMQGSEQASTFAQLGGWLLYTFSIGSMLMVGNLVLDVRWLKAYTWIFLILGALFTIVCWRWGVEGAAWRFFRYGISSGTFWTMLAVVGLGQCLSNKDLNWKWRLLAGAISISSLAFGWIRGKEWISGWLPAVVAVGVMIWMKNWKQGLLLTLIVAILLIPNFQKLYSSVNSETQQWSTESRFMTWPIMYELVKTDPIFGLGMANYWHYTMLYGINGYNVNFNSHNNYWDIAAQTGLVGLGLFLWLAYAIFWLGLKVRNRASDGFSFAYANTAIGLLIGCLVAGMLADWFLPFLYNIGFNGFRSSTLAWLFLGGLLSLDAIQRKRAKNAA